YIHSPAGDNFFVALHCASDRNLWCPTQLLQQPRHVVLVVTDAELPVDNLGDANAGPNVAAETIRLCSVPKEIRNHAFLCDRQLGRMPWRRMRPQCCRARALSLVHPLADRRRGNVQGICDVMLSPTATFQFP